MSESPGYWKYLTKLPTFTRIFLLPERATATPHERFSQPTFNESEYHPLFSALVIDNESLFYKKNTSPISILLVIEIVVKVKLFIKFMQFNPIDP